MNSANDSNANAVSANTNNNADNDKNAQATTSQKIKQKRALPASDKRARVLRLRRSADGSITKGKGAAKQTFREKKRLLEESFAKINVELEQKARAEPDALPPAGYNVFEEILKVKQVINLDAGDEQSFRRNKVMEGTSTSSLLLVESVEESIQLIEEDEEKDKDGDGKEADHPKNGFNERVQTEKKSRSSGAQNAQKPLIDAGPSSSSNSGGASSSSKLANLPKSTSLNDASFLSRVRFVTRSPPIFLNALYEMTGLRYFQNILGSDLYDVVPLPSPPDHQQNNPNSNNADQQLPSSSTNTSGADPVYSSMPLKVVSFNILCQRSMEKTEFLYGHLSRARHIGFWEARKKLLFVELGLLNADVFCLQEVQDSHYEQDLLPYFEQLGYKSLYTPRNGDDFPDGCAVFWRTSRLDLVLSDPVYYHLGCLGMDRPNVGQVLAFSLCGTRSIVCISNTHIYYNMKRGDIKLGQIAYLLGSMHKMESFVRSHYLDQHFVGQILCGDFNMEVTSPLHRFIVERRIGLRADRYAMARALRNVEQLQQPNLHYYFNAEGGGAVQFGQPPPAAATAFSNNNFQLIRLPAHKLLINDKCIFVENDKSPELLSQRHSILTHCFTFASVYEHWNQQGELEISSFHSKEACAPDFIFYTVNETRLHEMLDSRDVNSQQNPMIPCGIAPPRELAFESFIRLRKRLSMPTQAQLYKTQGRGPMPNMEYGSDHLALFAEFELLVCR